MICEPRETYGAVRIRQYQHRAIGELAERVHAGAKRVLLVAATGSGKTSLAGAITARAVEAGRRVLFVAHRRELITQAYDRFRLMGVPERQVGVIMASDPRRKPGAMVQVASIDTLRNRAKPLADIVFIDECHRALSRSYRDLSAHYDRALHIGLTATPYRADGKGLGDAYDEMVVVASPRELIDQGYLVEPRVFTIPPNAMPDLSAVRVRRGDYDERQLAEVMDRHALVGNIVEHWTQHAAGVRTIVFAASVAHSKHIAERFREAGVAAEHLDGMTPTPERDALLARLASGETTVCVNVMCLCEGFDLPAVKCAILARPTKSTGLYLQMAGRILRPWNDQPAVILDHAGCALEHGLPQDARQFSLEGTKKRKGGRMSPPTKTCPECFAVVAVATRICPSCGVELMEAREVPEEAADALVEVTPEDVRRIEWERLQREAARRGYKPGWAFYRYKERFGEKPPQPPRKRRRRPSIADKEAVWASLTETESAGWAKALYRVQTGDAPPVEIRR